MEKVCPHCSARFVPIGMKTCGNSYCQEADTFYNLAKNSRKGSAKRAEATRRADDAAEKARKQGMQLNKSEAVTEGV